jgi:hypothetical protein
MEGYAELSLEVMTAIVLTSLLELIVMVRTSPTCKSSFGKRGICCNYFFFSLQLTSVPNVMHKLCVSLDNVVARKDILGLVFIVLKVITRVPE